MYLHQLVGSAYRAEGSYPSLWHTRSIWDRIATASSDGRKPNGLRKGIPYRASKDPGGVIHLHALHHGGIRHPFATNHSTDPLLRRSRT